MVVTSHPLEASAAKSGSRGIDGRDWPMSNSASFRVADTVDIAAE